MVPSLVDLNGSPWAVLPPGIHPATLAEVEAAFAINSRRRELFAGLKAALSLLQSAGCPTVYLNGSFVSAKPIPGDYDACWDHNGVSKAKLDPVFLEFANSRQAQKSAFQGEFFPAAMLEGDTGKPFIEMFQIDRYTGDPKGIVSISLAADPQLAQGAKT